MRHSQYQTQGEASRTRERGKKQNESTLRGLMMVINYVVTRLNPDMNRYFSFHKLVSFNY